jgi:hypothetical protein
VIRTFITLAVLVGGCNQTLSPSGTLPQALEDGSAAPPLYGAVRFNAVGYYGRPLTLPRNQPLAVGSGGWDLGLATSGVHRPAEGMVLRGRGSAATTTWNPFTAFSFRERLTFIYSLSVSRGRPSSLVDESTVGSVRVVVGLTRACATCSERPAFEIAGELGVSVVSMGIVTALGCPMVLRPTNWLRIDTGVEYEFVNDLEDNHHHFVDVPIYLAAQVGSIFFGPNIGLLAGTAGRTRMDIGASAGVGFFLRGRNVGGQVMGSFIYHALAQTTLPISADARWRLVVSLAVFM